MSTKIPVATSGLAILLGLANKFYLLTLDVLGTAQLRGPGIEKGSSGERLGWPSVSSFTEQAVPLRRRVVGA